MSTLFRRSNGIYYILYEEKRKRRWKSTRRRRLNEALKELEAFNEPHDRAPKSEDLLGFMKVFLKFGITTFSPKTIDIYRRALQGFLALIGNKRLASISPRDVDLYLAHRVTQVSPTSVNIDLRTLRAAFYRAARWGLIRENPFKTVPQIRFPDRGPAYFTREDFEKLLSLISERWVRELIIVAVSTGLRRGELVNLTWENVDFKGRLLCIQSSEFYRTKAGRRRWIPMSDAVFKLLREKTQRSLGEYVFTLNGRKIYDDWLGHKFKKYIRRAGLNERLHFHSLRHTFATWLVQEGVSIYEVQKLLGHSSISVTQVYSHLAASELHSAVNKISVSCN